MVVIIEHHPQTIGTLPTHLDKKLMYRRHGMRAKRQPQHRATRRVVELSMGRDQRLATIPVGNRRHHHSSSSSQRAITGKGIGRERIGQPSWASWALRKEAEETNQIVSTHTRIGLNSRVSDLHHACLTFEFKLKKRLSNVSAILLHSVRPILSFTLQTGPDGISAEMIFVAIE